MFNYVIKLPQAQVSEVATTINNARVQIQVRYTQLGTAAQPLELGRVIARPRSIVVEVGRHTSLNTLTDALREILPSPAVRLPSWG